MGHPNLVLFLGAVFNDPQKMLVTEYLEQGSLLDFYVRMWHTSKAQFLPRVEVYTVFVFEQPSLMMMMMMPSFDLCVRSVRGLSDLIHQLI
jgi:hypothetical protein